MDNTVKDGSSDDMIDIRIEESLVRESLMKIDASNIRDDVLLLSLFLGIIIFSFILGCTNLQEYNNENPSQPIVANNVINYQKSDLTRRNRFVSFFLYLDREEVKDDVRAEVNLTYEAMCFSDNSLIHKSNKQFNNLNLYSAQGYTSTYPFNFYFDQIIDYNRISLDIRLITDPEINFENVTISVYYGDEINTVISTLIKFTFSVIHFILLIKTISKLRTTTIRYWHLEQKLTIPLIFISIFYNNPFELIQIVSPSYAFLIYNCIIKSIFSAYFEFFILALFDSLRFKNRKIKACFFTPKIIFILFLFFISLVHRIYITITSFDTSPALDQDKSESVFRIIDLILYLLYYVWFMVSVILAGFQVDITERYKFNVYFTTCFASLMLLGIVYCLNLFAFFENKTLGFFVPLTTINLFVILMFCFHYPYEVLDGRYNSNDNGSNDRPGKEQNDAFVDTNAQIVTIN
ncbi:hypothetical protein M9Y10_031781 [Tritrichomonas musculus]|uniref:Wntless-like transmembrane domain-containing protein n=1 Tax=Tritrichomonas musculus TaxID=1915356 RepID=A0ABR2GZU4_9EUKA